jgi:peptide/nickel transport system substrate-binding protein
VGGEQGVDPSTLDPQFEESGALANVENELFSQLISYDSEMRISSDAAASFRAMPDHVTWQFKIRPGITFWNGEPLDARAVKFTFDRIGDQALRKQGLNDPYYGRVGFDHIAIVDNYTVNFVLKKPSIVFPIYTPFNPILAPDYYGSHSPQETAIRPMGSGPWMFVERVKDDHLIRLRQHLEPRRPPRGPASASNAWSGSTDRSMMRPAPGRPVGRRSPSPKTSGPPRRVARSTTCCSRETWTP